MEINFEFPSNPANISVRYTKLDDDTTLFLSAFAFAILGFVLIFACIGAVALIKMASTKCDNSRMADCSCPWLIPFIVTLVLLILTVGFIIVNFILQKFPGRWGKMRTSIRYLQTTVRRTGLFKGDLEQDNYIDIEYSLQNKKIKEDRPYSSLKIKDITSEDDTYLEPNICKQEAANSSKGGMFSSLAVRQKDVNVGKEQVTESKKNGNNEVEQDSSSDDYIQPP